MTNLRRLMVGVAAVAAVLAGCDPYSKASTAPPAIVTVTATSGADATKGTQTAPGVWTIDGAGTSCAGGAVSAAQPVIFVTFNKQMNPASIQSSVTDCTPAADWLKVEVKDATGTVVPAPTGTAWYSCYDPSSPTAAEGGSAIIFLGNAPAALKGAGTATCTAPVAPESGWSAAQAIDAAATGVTSAHITGTVSDKEGRTVPVDLTVNYAPNPGTVRNLTASAVSGSTITLAWTDRACAAGAETASVVNEIRTQDADGNYTVKVGELPYAAGAQTFPVTGDPAAPASYAVVAVTTVPGVATPFEQEQAAITNVVPGLPTPPAPTVALSAGNKLPLVVTVPGGIPAGAADVDVYRASYGSEASTTVGAFSRLGNVGAGKGAFIDVSSAANSRYVYKLVAVQSVGGVRARGADSPVSTAFITAPTDPGAGTPLEVTNNSVTLEWNFLSGSIQSNTETLALERSATETGTYAGVGTVTPDADNLVIDATDTTVAADTTYWYRLSAGNSAGTVKSTPVSVTTLAFPAPTNVVGTRAGTDVNVAWTAPASGTVTGYVVERELSNACGFTAVGQSTTTTFKDVAAPASVSYRVTATGAGGKSSPPSAPSAIVP